MSNEASIWRGRALGLCLCLGQLAPSSFGESAPEPGRVSDRMREGALARARIWGPPPRALQEADLGANPVGPDSFAYDAVVECKFRPEAGTSGATPKFLCEFPGGDVLKVKYGSAEVFTETAATRLLSALGAGADRVYQVATLRCRGCPEDPDALLRCISSPFPSVRQKCGQLYGEVGAGGEVKLKLDYSSSRDFGPVAIERRAEGTVMTADTLEGWGFRELDRAQKGQQPPTRAERDALRLVAVLLDHWDNRADNQRLLCLPGALRGNGWCDRPLAYIHDVGGTFGRVGGDSKDERKLDVEGWRAVPVWKDAAACLVEIDSPPLHGATFDDVSISDAGRRFLADRLALLSEDQVRDLFEGAHFADFDKASEKSRDVGQWVAAFQEKVRQIKERPSCPNP